MLMILDNYALIHVLWLEIIFMVAHPVFSKQTAISMKIHMQMKPSSRHHALSIQLNNTPNLVKICSVVVEIPLTKKYHSNTIEWS